MSQMKRSPGSSLSCSRESLNNSMVEVFEWLDTLPLNRPKTASGGRLHRDFADGRLLAEVLAFHFPKLVDKHNYPDASAKSAKRVNWQLLRRKVLEKLEINITDEIIELIIHSRVGGIEEVLKNVYDVINAIEQSKADASERQRVETQAEVELAAAKPYGPWVPNSCYGRVHDDGREEIVVCGKLMIEKSKYEAALTIKDEIIAEATGLIKQLRSQVSRLQMTVNLKEDHLVDLTKEVCQLRGEFLGSGDSGVDQEMVEDIQNLCIGSEVLVRTQAFDE